MDKGLYRWICFQSGYGVRIENTHKTSEELFNPCVSCSNYEAEALAIEHIVIFTDSMSVLQALENKKLDTSLLINKAKTLNAFYATV